MFAQGEPPVGDGAFRRLAQKVDLELLARVAKADCEGRGGGFDCSAMDWFVERARALGVEHAPPEPLVKGRHLLELGVVPGPALGEVLRQVYERQLDGTVADVRRGVRARARDGQREATILTTMRRAACLLASLRSAFAASALAQQKEPIGRFAADIRADLRAPQGGAERRDRSRRRQPATCRHEASASSAARTSIRCARASRSRSASAANVVFARGSSAIETENADGTTTTSPTVATALPAISPEISLNFGHRNGWSYISGGMFGRSKLYLDRDDAPALTPRHAQDDQLRRRREMVHQRARRVLGRLPVVFGRGVPAQTAAGRAAQDDAARPERAASRSNNSSRAPCASPCALLRVLLQERDRQRPGVGRGLGVRLARGLALQEAVPAPSMTWLCTASRASSSRCGRLDGRRDARVVAAVEADDRRLDLLNGAGSTTCVPSTVFIGGVP